MKIEIDIPDELTKEKLVLCSIEGQTPVAYFNVYEEGDVWLKTQGCEACPPENRRRCCNQCPMYSDKGCFLHLNNSDTKPFRCVVYPVPEVTLSWCSQEFKCISGVNKNKIKRVNKPNNIFDEK